MIYTLVRRNDENNIDSIISFDSITSFDESWSATVTTQTVEYGFDVTDNINIEAPSYNIEAVISSYSLFNRGKEIVWDSENFVTSNVDSSEDHITARKELIRIFKERSIITIVESTANSNDEDLETKFKDLTSGYFEEIPNCVITSLSIAHPPSGTGAFYVSLKIQKINVAKVSTIELTKEEMSPLLRGLVVAPTTTASSTKDLDGKDIPSNSIAEKEGDIKNDIDSGIEGEDWFDVHDQKTKELQVIKDETAAQKDMNEYMARTEFYCDLFRRADGFYKRCRRT